MMSCGDEIVEKNESNIVAYHYLQVQNKPKWQLIEFHTNQH